MVKFGTDGVRGEFDPSGGPEAINGQSFEGLAYAYATDVMERTDTENPTFIVGGEPVRPALN